MVPVFRHMILFSWACFLLMTSPMYAQSGNEGAFTASVSEDLVKAGERFRLSFTLKNIKGKIDPPSLGHFDQVSGPSRSSSFKFINGKTSRTITLTYRLMARDTGLYTIGAAHVKADGERYSTDPIEVRVVEEEQAKSASASTKKKGGQGGYGKKTGKLFARIELNKQKVYRGEEVLLSYALYSRYNNLRIVDNDFPDINGCWTQEVELENKSWQEDIERINGKRYRKAVIRRLIVYPQQYGTIKVDPVKLTCQVNRGFFSKGKKVEVTSNAVRLQVKDLPAGAPSSFNGMVGQFDMEIDPPKENVKTNGSMDLSLTISGQGNLKLLEHPSLDLPPDFEVYDPQLKDHVNVNKHGISGGRTWEFPIIPRHQGKYSIAPIEFSFFDPRAEEYRTIRSDTINISVSGSKEGGAPAITKGPEISQKQDVAILDQEIRYIDSSVDTLYSRDSRFFGSPLFITGMVGPPFLLLVLVLLRDRVQREGDSKELRRKRAGKVATKRLAKAEKLMEKGDPAAFHEAVSKAVHEYVSDKFGIPLAELSRERIRAELNDWGLNQALIDQLDQALQACEMARFAPDSGFTERVLYDRTREAITELEQNMK